MRTLLLALVILSQQVRATTVTYVTIKMPVWLQDDGDSHGIDLLDVLVLVLGPEATYAAIAHEYVPMSMSSWAKTGNINVASLYGIRVSLDFGRETGTSHWIITIDASSAKQPEGYPFTIEQVTDSVVTCVKVMTPTVPEDEKKVTVKVLPPKK